MHHHVHYSFGLTLCDHCQVPIPHRVFEHNDRDYCNEVCALRAVGQDCIKCGDCALELDKQGFCDPCLNCGCDRCGATIRWAGNFGVRRETWTSERGHVFEEMSLLCKACAGGAA